MRAKRTAYVFVNDFGHPKEKILPIIPMIFDYEKWHICVMDSIESICLMPNAPNLIVSFKQGISTIVEDKPSWYETSAFTYQWMRWVKEDGCGLLLVHAGLPGIPEDHPVMTQGAIGCFAGHPLPAGSLYVEPVRSLDHPIIKDVKPFSLTVDEHFQIGHFDETRTTVLAYSYSDEGGKQPAAWAHEIGKGRVAVLTPGHSSAQCEPLRNNEMIKLMSNAIEWCGQEE